MPSEALNWVRRTFRFPVFGRLRKFLSVLFVYAVGVCALEYVLQKEFKQSAPPPRVAEVVLTTLLFGMLLQFRTNTAYDRWYEGRRLWGTLVNVSRNLVLKASHVVRPGADDDAEVRRLVAEFATALRLRLGGVESRPGHVPMQTTGRLYDLFHKWSRDDRVSTAELLLLDAELRQFMDVAGACERIRSTPLTASYKGLLRTGIGLFLVGLPWLIIADVGWGTVPTTLAVGYVLLALELIADDIEDPFGFGPDDLKLDDVVKVIHSATAETPTGRWPVPGGVVQVG